MKIKEALRKIVYKATIMTYEQSEMSLHGECINEGYSSDLKRSLFADCEVEHIAYDNYRKRVALTVTKEDLKEVVMNANIKDLTNFLIYHHGVHFYGHPSAAEVSGLVYNVINKY